MRALLAVRVSAFFTRQRLWLEMRLNSSLQPQGVAHCLSLEGVKKDFLL